MLDGGEIVRFLHLATRSRFVSTRKDANVIPPWNEAVSGFAYNNRQKKKQGCFANDGWCKCIPTKQPSKIRRNAMAASPSLKLVGHDGPDAAGACNERMLAPRTRDQRTTVCTQKEDEEVGDDEQVGHQQKNAPGGGGATYMNRPERRPPRCERSTTCESNLKGGGEVISHFVGGAVVQKML